MLGHRVVAAAVAVAAAEEEQEEVVADQGNLSRGIVLISVRTKKTLSLG